MEYRGLGNTGLRVSAVGLGTGGQSVLGQKKGMTESESRQVIYEALDLGVNMFDTSPAYLDSEQILGRALQNAGVADQVRISTKVVPERRMEDGEQEISTLTPDEVNASVERSLRRFGRQQLDVLILHGVSPEGYGAVIDHVYPVVAKLKEEGKVRLLGISGIMRTDVRQVAISRAVASSLFDVVMLRYNIFFQRAERHIFTVAREQDMFVMGTCPVEPPLSRPTELRQWIEDLKAAGKLGDEALSTADPVVGWIEKGSEALTAAGMKFAVNQPTIGVVFTGTSSPRHLAHNVGAAVGPPLPEETENALRRIYGRLAEERW